MRAALAALAIVAAAGCGGDGRESPAVDAGGRADGATGDGPASSADAAIEGDRVRVPAGPFTMGCDDCDADEAPAHEVTLGAFDLDRTEVTQAAYGVCADAEVCDEPADPDFDPAGTPDLPVVDVTWDEARVFCGYAGGRLPTEAEWEKAARGDDGRRFPWGADEPDGCELANVEGCGGEAGPVGLLPAGASPYGALDMAGNVWEWVADYYAADAYDAHVGAGATDPTGPASGTQRVYRGGSAGNLVTLATTTNRASTYNPEVGGSGLGFRCVVPVVE